MISNVLAIIPARYASTRFPGKPLALLDGKYIVQHVYERVSRVFSYVVVATDDKRIFDAVESCGGKAVMTREDHRSGTDRCLEAYEIVSRYPNMPPFDVVINIQGDEPFIAESQLEAICKLFDIPQTDIATLVKPFSPNTSWEVLCNPNTPKVVIGNDNQAIYFSRSVIPYMRGIEKEHWTANHQYYKHIGLYAYRVSSLKAIAHLPKGKLETCESLEQLRWLEAGLKIRVAMTDVETVGIDTPDDLLKAEQIINSKI